MKKIRIKAPATIANLVCGFDILGLCLEEPYDIMEVELCEEDEVRIAPDAVYHLPIEAHLNTAGLPLLEFKAATGLRQGFRVSIEKKIKPGSGLGSSAASAAGAVFAAKLLTGSQLAPDHLVRFAMAGEKLASGVKHADNVAPCLLGGITLIRSIFPLDIVKLDAPRLYITVIHPQIEVRTSDARQILRKEVQLKDAIRQWGNIAGLVAGLMRGDYDLIGRSLEDVIIEPVRSVLIPGFDEIKRKCREAGALGGGISGSGPSLFMLSSEEAIAHTVELIMSEVYDRIGLDYHTYVTRLNTRGCTLIDQT